MASTRQKIISISLPESTVERITRAARAARRSRAAIVKDAVDLYVKSQLEEEPTPAERAAIRRGHAAFKRGDYVTIDALRHDLERPRHRPGKKTA